MSHEPPSDLGASELAAAFLPLDDVVIPFAIEGLDVRGRLGRFGPAVDTILKRHAYPAPVSRLLGEAIVLTAMIGSALKFEGRFILQTQSEGPLKLMIVDFEKPGRIRACAKFDEAELDDALGADAADANAVLLGTGHLALTIDPGGGRNRYQGVVPLEGHSLADAADHYFRQSEQIQTMVRLAVAEVFTKGDASKGGGKGAGEGPRWRAGGIMIQHLPKPGTAVPQRDLDPGDVPEGVAAPDDADEHEDWAEARALVATVEAHELTDPLLASNRLLLRLFHERGVRAFQAERIEEACRCSRQRIAEMLAQFSEDDLAAMVKDDRIEVTCEFCSTAYDFDPADVG